MDVMSLILYDVDQFAAIRLVLITHAQQDNKDVWMELVIMQVHVRIHKDAKCQHHIIVL